MNDSDLICLDDTPPHPKKSGIEGVPLSFAGDDLKRFSFGCASFDDSHITNTHATKSTNVRKSLSQPVRGSAYRSIQSESKDSPVEQSTQYSSDLKKPRLKKSQLVLKEFFGVYCLISRSPLKHYKNRTYVGYTVDPNRRITQHNGGREKGGAKKTDNRGPWDMVSIVHGFPNNTAALRFEWAMQNPDKSKALKEFALKKERKETPYAFRLRIACHLMNIYPWRRFSLTFRWLILSEELPFPSCIQPPKHTSVKFGLVEKAYCAIPQCSDGYVIRGNCGLCSDNIDKLSHLVRCLSESCKKHFHANCLARYSLKSSTESKHQMFPMKSCCPSCHLSFPWGDVIREHRTMLKISDAQAISTLKELVPKSTTSIADL